MIDPTCSIDDAFRIAKAMHGLTGMHPGQAWYQAAEIYRWEERADAWDGAKRRQLLAKEEASRFDARNRRRRILRKRFDVVMAVLATDKLDELTVGEAR